MTSSDMTESTDPSTPTTIVNSPINPQKKRSSSPMSPPHTIPWTPSDPIHSPHNHEKPFKAIRKLSLSEDAVKRPWTNAEQEALYIAVERYKLYGQWAEVKERMHLHRSTLEIEQEYARLYGELPESDDEAWPIQTSKSVSVSRTSVPEQTTPALTTTSPSTLSARSSQETFNTHVHRHAHHPAPEPIHRFSPRKSSVSSHPALDDYQDDENDDVGMNTEQHSPLSRPSSAKSTMGRNRSSSTVTASTDIKPTRTVRVWTPQQSEQLKNLIEDCFPGGYRINWVWVASQMGNTFTRKQCKNKWEIMRRRAGTEEEVALLKKGYEEFGPSWNRIQEKYLPERSQGGISIMWSLLQAREAEQQQQQQQQAVPRGGDETSEHEMIAPTARPLIHYKKQSRAAYDNLKWETSSQNKAVGRPSTKKSRDQPYPPRTTILPSSDGPELNYPIEERDRQQFDHYSKKGSTSREASLSPVWTREGTYINTSAYPAMHQYREAQSAHRFSVSSTESLSAMTGQQDSHNNLHQQVEQTPQAESEPWTERNRPMTWTEPLTRRLEDIIIKNFPNNQKVYWSRVSELMGVDPVVTKEQCKRRWYLMSQYEHLRSQHDKVGAVAVSSTMDVDIKPSTRYLYSRRHDSQGRSSPLNSGSVYMRGDTSISTSTTQISGNMELQWSDQEVELLERGVEQFGRSWTDIQRIYLPERSINSIAAKWDYLQTHISTTEQLGSKRPVEYAPWSEHEVDLLRQGVERFGRAWADIQRHYLPERSVGSMASKWDYLSHKMRSTSGASPGRSRLSPGIQRMGIISNTDITSGTNLSENEMEITEDRLEEHGFSQ
ncbi:hypothetical protein BX616_002691 [Lobosporangium transversale]|uniref:Myb-like domain-containing protein n=1 Tax=Lobosporangium transversale TaxID=64571 RepID=A0A1Y2GY44_9FUNG|nr:hypothetical protein BCR41DRAFT_346484 [Lobosporangium transversale]KAF9900094.1 hypothetical protein BX616_002691 [Lobosporangium transversale]ORZ27197.1 hypothetical protein BCR41DRAFT_346484 [Lobosporangium transversale]|eukprot:XP_021884924.1 hypothetical protein BCR41DRAFT_346484 [Lobosporangium transversale]